MTARVKDILAALEALAPERLAEDWDNVGLQVGHPEWPAARVLIALDPTPEVVDEAVREGAGAIVTHHPLLFKPLQRLNLATASGALIQRLVEKRVAVIAAHTNLDSVAGGINDVLVDMLALESVTVLQVNKEAGDDQAGLGRVGELPQPVPFENLVRDIKARLDLEHIRYAGQPDKDVQRVAVCSGSGGSLVKLFLESQADVYVTGDVRYHDARDIEAHRRGVIDIGHFESEHVILERLAQQLGERLANQGCTVAVQAATCEKSPFFNL